MPDALDSCKGKNLNDDIAAIEDWAKVFAEPATLVKKVSKNWLLHGTEIKKDITNEEADWSSGAYFNAGKDAAAAIDRLVPFQSKMTYGLDVKEPIEFLGGLLDGMIGDNHLAELQHCETDAEAVLKNADLAFKCLRDRDYVGGIKHILALGDGFLMTA